MQPHEQLKLSFDNFFRQMSQAEPTAYIDLMRWADSEFDRLGYREEIPIGVENILIVRLDAIGDMIVTSGFIREVRANFPNARITLVVSPLVYPIVELCPYVNEVFVFDIDKFNENLALMLEHIAVFCKENLWRKHFSIAFSPQWGSYSLYTLMLCWLSGARERVGFSTQPYLSWDPNISEEKATYDNFLLTRNIITPRSAVADIEKHFYILEAVGLKVNQTHMELWFGAADVLQACMLLKDISSTSKKVLLGLGASEANRKYPVEKYLVALRKLAKKNLVFVIVGGKSELDDANFIEQNLPQGKVLNLVGKTTLRETEAIISQMDFYIGNDSGVMHMAAAAQVPVLVLYREAADKEDYLPGAWSEYQRFPPWQTQSVILRPDHQLEECAKKPLIYGWCHADKPHCITQITPQEIIAGFEVLEEL